MSDLSYGGWNVKTPDWRGGVNAMQGSDAVSALGDAAAAAFDPSSYSSQSTPEASVMDKIAALASGLKKKPGEDDFIPAPELKFAALPAAPGITAGRLPGQVASYAGGGMAMDALSQMAALSAVMGGAQMPMMGPQQPASATPATSAPLYAAAGALVEGPGHGVSDDVEARLSKGEFVMPADVVSALGKGSSDAGADWLRTLCQQARAMHIRQVQTMPEPA